MPLLVMQVAVGGDLVEVFEMPVSGIEGRRMLAEANEDERSITQVGQDLEDGEVWIDLIDADGETLLDQVACFHRADASDALQLHFGWRPTSSGTVCQSRTSRCSTQGIRMRFRR